jgi:pimeloyl-ACP methyl ester carboxylesterase
MARAPDAWMPGTVRRVEIGGLRLHVEDTGGSGPAVVFSHGLLLSTRLWDAQVDALSGRYRCIAYDHRGQGQSDDTGGRSISLDTCAADAEALVKALGAVPCHFVGLSMGGMVGMRLAARRPEILRSLSLIETSADPEPEENLGRYRMLNLVARFVGPWAVAGKVMHILFGRTFNADPARAEERTRWTARLAGNRRSIWRAVNGVIERPSIHGELAAVRLPTLVMVGEEDVATVPARAERIASAIAGARLLRVPRAGHTSPVEEPATVTAALRDFLASVEARRAGPA